MYNAEKMLHQLGKVPYASVYNFQPWTSVNKKSSLKASLKYPDKLLMELRKKSAVYPLRVYPFGEEKRNLRHTTFYSINNELRKYTNKRKKDPLVIAESNIRHQSGLMDIFLAFINLYPDYEISIEWDKSFCFEKRKKYPNDESIKEYHSSNYVPDGVIKLTSSDMKEYYFIIEFERTKTAEQIRKDKFRICNSIKKFQSYGLSRYTKFLFIYTYELYNVFARPIEYQNEDIIRQHQAVNHRLVNLIKTSQELISDTYRFMSFQDFYRLNETVWFNNKLEKVRLIS